eukprot:TRINITY_DN992_c0_g1_i4.p2 TRINITY_DN992_c0_g1~~TRINITY_DN992_c0_g1_i4.p2  ORF type:complete len:101 (+),score=29.60 TRINITY_DN992_c0_g1_i4:366-668(+)
MLTPPAQSSGINAEYGRRAVRAHLLLHADARVLEEPRVAKREAVQQQGVAFYQSGESYLDVTLAPPARQRLLLQPRVDQFAAAAALSAGAWPRLQSGGYP